MSSSLSFYSTALTTLALFSLCASDQESPHPKIPKLPIGTAAAVGAIARATEIISTGQPLAAIGTQVMLRQPLSFNLSRLYAGFFVHLAGLAPLTATQRMLRSEGEALIQNNQEKDLCELQKLSIAFAAGGCSALIATPAEAIAVYQQVHKAQGITKTASQSMKELKGKVWHGFAPTFWRDALYTAGYGQLFTIVQNNVHQKLGDNQPAALLAGAATGIGIATITQPLVLIKTRLQGDPHQKIYHNSQAVIKAVQTSDGYIGFFRGLPLRATRLAIGIPILATTERYCANFLHNS